MCRILFSSLFTCAFATSSFAGITVNGTRIIFPSNAKSVNVQLRNTFDTPALAQVWIDNGNDKVIPKANEIPFVITPSLTRIEGKKGQIIRIIPTTTESLPQDRESLFWFNLHDIPPENTQSKASNKLKFTVRSRLKLFYRPENLQMRPVKAYEALTFSRTGHGIDIKNPSPYFIVMTHLNASKNELLKESVVIKPFDHAEITPKTSNTTATKLNYTVLNDYGDSLDFSTTLTK